MGSMVRLAQCYRCRRLFDARKREERYCPDCAAEIKARFDLPSLSHIPWAALVVMGAILYFVLIRSRDPVTALLAVVLVGVFAVWRLGRS
ncbi:MAG: hypothetical protein WD535_00785 [Thermaerobacterales bacterium]